MTPEVSVVIAAYNAARFIDETLNSVETQDHRSFEIIVVDDGSTDGTGEIVTSRHPGVRCLRIPNSGQPAARNTGIRAARGAYVAFLDADDRWLPGKLVRQMALVRERGVAWVYGDAITVSAAGSVLGRMGRRRPLQEGDILRPLLLTNFIPSVTPLVRRDVFETVGGFDERPGMSLSEDWNMWLRVAGRFEAACIRDVLGVQVEHPQSMTATSDRMANLEPELAIVEATLAAHGGRVADLASRARQQVYYRAALRLLATGDRLRARTAIGRGLGHAVSGGALALMAATYVPAPVARAAHRVVRRMHARQAGSR